MVISVWLTYTVDFLYPVGEMATRRTRLPFSYNINNSRRPFSSVPEDMYPREDTSPV